MENLRISLVQATLHWEQKAKNLAQFDQQLAVLAGQTDLVILPEMFTTGFSMNSRQLAESMNGTTMSWLAKTAEFLKAVVTGSFIATENGHFYNRLVWMRPDGTYEVYDKKHLFTLASEQDSYSPGTSRKTMTLKGWKICPLICYDLRFPIWSRNTDNYDVLVYIASWPDRRRAAWRTLLRARAIENQAYTIGVNRVGTDGFNLNYAGDSALIDYSGAVHYELSQQTGIFTARLDYQQLMNFREKLPFLDDRDDYRLL